MEYSKDTRKPATRYMSHSPEEAQRELGIGKSTLRRWKNQQAQTGMTDKKPLERKPRKYHNEALKTYIKNNP